MHFETSITLRDRMVSASEHLDKTTESLDQIRQQLDSRLDGRGRGALVGAVVGASLWVIAYLAASLVAMRYVPNSFAVGALCAAEALAFALLVDNFVKLGFYGKLLDFKSEVGSLGDQIARGKASLAADLEELLAARKKGWDMPLSIMPSVPLRAREIGEEVSRLTELSTGFLNGLKNVMYYVTGVVITVVGSLALFELADDIVGVEEYWYYIAMAVACVAEVIFMRFIWSKTHCQVTGVTMLTTLAGPVLFAAVIAAAAIALIALGVALAIGAIIAVLGSMSGG